MKTVTVRLPIHVVADIETESRQRRISKSDVVRERLTARRRAVRERPASFDAIADLVGSVDGLPASLSARRKDYLRKTRYGVLAFDLRTELGRVLKLMAKYRDIHMSVADACLVRMTETSADPVLLTTDQDFRIYRRHGRQVVPALMPS